MRVKLWSHYLERETTIFQENRFQTVKYLRTDLENYLEDKCTLADIAGRRVRVYISGSRDGDWVLSLRKAGAEWETDNPNID